MKEHCICFSAWSHNKCEFFCAFFSRVLTELDLSHNGIDPAGAEALASALRVNEVLTTLNLRDNEAWREDEEVASPASPPNRDVKPLAATGFGGSTAGAPTLASRTPHTQ